MFLRNQEKGIISKDLSGFKVKNKDIFHLKYFDDEIIGKMLRPKKEEKYRNYDLNLKLNTYFNSVYFQIRKKIIND